MLKKILTVLISGCMASCSILPGMQNPNINQMQLIKTPTNTIPAVLIPITDSVIRSQTFSKYIYYIAPADILNITVWQHPEFSSRDLTVSQDAELPITEVAAGKEGYLVNPDGYIYFPLIGHVFVAGKTVEEIRLRITKRLKKYVKNPEINVRIADFRGRKIYILGEIMKPGFIPISDKPINITDALLMSGGVDPNAADPGHIYVIRKGQTQPIVYWLRAKTPEALLLGEQFYLKPNDIVYISSAPATRWNRVLNQLLPTIQTVWYTQSIIKTR